MSYEIDDPSWSLHRRSMAIVDDALTAGTHTVPCTRSRRNVSGLFHFVRHLHRRRVSRRVQDHAMTIPDTVPRAQSLQARCVWLIGLVRTIRMRYPEVIGGTERVHRDREVDDFSDLPAIRGVGHKYIVSILLELA